MKPRDYCCCAIPIVNAGVYTVLIEQIILGFTAGTLAISTPHIVGAATPSVAPWIFAIVCYVGAGLQVLGFIGVSREKPILFRRYLTLHSVVSLAGFSVGAVWIAISASRHSTAQDRCITDFYPINENTSTSSEGQTLCNIFPWVDIGIMGGMWVFFGLTQIYFYTVLSSYGKSQRYDHKKYTEVYNASKRLDTDIPLTNRGEATGSPASDYDSQNQTTGSRNYAHVRQDSAASVSTVLAERMQTQRDAFSDGGYGYTQPGYPQYGDHSDLSHPSHAHTQEPGPTPTYNDDYYSGGNSYGNQYMDGPQPSQSHPAEGSFHRKTPRYMNSDANEYGDGRYQ